MKKEIKLYTWPYCRYSNGAKKLLDERGLEYTDINIFNNNEMRRQLEAKTNHYSYSFYFYWGYVYRRLLRAYRT